MNRWLLILTLTCPLAGSGCVSDKPEPLHSNVHMGADVNVDLATVGIKVSREVQRAYGKAFQEAIVTRWHQLLEGRAFRPQTGKVVLSFWLHSNGSVSNLGVNYTSVEPGLTRLCQSAILDAAPFPPWPQEMRDQIVADFESLTMTFNYN